MGEINKNTDPSLLRKWGSWVMSTDPGLRQQPPLSDVRASGERVAVAEYGTAQRASELAERRLLVLPYVLEVASAMTIPSTMFRNLGYDFEYRGKDRYKHPRSSLPVGERSKKVGTLVGRNGSEMPFQMRYKIISMRGQSFLHPITYEQNLKPYEGIGKLSSGGGSEGEYVVNFKNGEIDRVNTGILACSKKRTVPSVTNTYLTNFLGKKQDWGRYRLFFYDLTTDPKLSVQVEEGREKMERAHYKFEDDIDPHNAELNGVTESPGVKPGKLPILKFVKMLEESIALIPAL